jgi:hypothetical protein
VPNILTLTVEQPDEILNTGAYGAGALMRVQTSATEDGVYADVSGTGSTPTVTVVTLTRSYTAYDPAGVSDSWYRTRFENVGATRLSDWSDPFQVAPEGSGLICSLWDVKQALGLGTSTTEDENILERIRQVGDEIHSMTGRLFVRDPASGTETWTEDVGVNGGLGCLGSRILLYPKGIAALTTLEVATGSQPESGGTYTTVTAAEWFLRPTATSRDYGWPATRVTISDQSGSYFAFGYNTVRLTGARGFATVPANIQGVAERAVTAAYLSKGTGAGPAVLGPNGGTTILRNISPADRETLMRYAVIPA